MNQTQTDKTSKNAENDVALPGHWLSPDGIQPLPKQVADVVPADTAQEAVHEVMTKGAARDIAPIAGNTPLHAAKGDDDLMSKPPTPAAATKGKAKRKP